jgi:hypothetical protein
MCTNACTLREAESCREGGRDTERQERGKWEREGEWGEGENGAAFLLD